MRLVRYNTWVEAQALQPAWNPLLASSRSDTIFLTWEWLDAWWKNYGMDRPLAVVGGWDGTELVGIAPFYIDGARRWGMKAKYLRFIGDGSADSDYLDCFAQAGREQEFVEALLDYWEHDDTQWDYAEWHGPKRESPCLRALLEAARQRSWMLSVEDVPCATLQLPSSWEEYLKILRPRFRSKLRSALAFIDSQPACVTHECCDADEIPSWLATLFQLHTARWGRRGLPGVFRSDAKRHFYHDITRAALDKGWLALYRLDWGERPLALQYGFVYANRFYLLQEGYDPDFETFRPGVALRGWLMRHWLEHGLTEYDFLAGVPKHKLDWGAQQRASTRLLVSPASSHRGSFIARTQFGHRVKEELGKVIPESVLALRRDLYTWRMRRHARAHGEGAPAHDQTNVLASRLHVPQAATFLLRQFANHWRFEPKGKPLYQWLRRVSGPECQVLIYHHVNDDGDPFFPGVPSDIFRRQMEYLARHCTLVSVDQIVTRAWRPVDGKPCVAVTFDDGYRDNFLCAFPILTSLQIPATVYLATGYVDCAEIPWYDQVALALKLTCVDRLVLNDVGGPKVGLLSRQDRLRARDRCITWLRALSEEERVVGLQALFKKLRVPAGLQSPNLMLTWNEVRQMARNGICIGAHTVTHPVMSRISRQQADQEVRISKATIEKQLQMEVRHFAYPFGQRGDYSQESMSAVQAAGFKSAVTTVSGFNPVDQDPFELRRFTPWESDPAMFALKLNWYRLVGLRPQPDLAARAVTASTQR